jgi:ABC-type cobalamin transport system permease subunit
MRRKKTIIKKKKEKKTVTKAKDDAAVWATHALKARHLSAICAKIECQRCIASGRIPQGVITKVLEANKPIYTWLTIDLIKKH